MAFITLQLLPQITQDLACSVLVGFGGDTKTGETAVVGVSTNRIHHLVRNLSYYLKFKF